MFRFVLLGFLCLYLVSNCSSAVRNRRAVNWNGNNWAMACDFTNNDLSNARTTAELCGPTCENTRECTHFTWTNWNGGTCWMKKGHISKNNAFSTNDQTMVCGVRSTADHTNHKPGGKSGKRGIAWPMENKQDSSDRLSGGKISWVYNWSPYRTNIPGTEFVPMLWSTNKGHDGRQFFNQAKNAKVVLGFNEPERGDQAAMSPGEAARAWKEFIEPLRAHGIRLGSPAIASTQEGLQWMDQFLRELNKLGGRIDFLALHWYGRGVNNFINWITSARQRFGNRYPVWVTEFACTSWNQNQPVSQQEVNDFMRESLARLDSLPWVERYAWFGAQRRLDAHIGQAIALYDSNGQLSQLGRNYIHHF